MFDISAIGTLELANIALVTASTSSHQYYQFHPIPFLPVLLSCGNPVGIMGLYSYTVFIVHVK